MTVQRIKATDDTGAELLRAWQLTDLNFLDLEKRVDALEIAPAAAPEGETFVPFLEVSTPVAF